MLPKIANEHLNYRSFQEYKVLNYILYTTQ